MKDKLEPNMYVRTEKNIFKIKKINDEFITIMNTQYVLHHSKFTGHYYFCDDDEVYTIGKASHNIIDLIEEKDLLEIEYFSLRYEKRVTRLFEVTYKEGRFINLDNAKCQFMLIDNDWTDNDKELEPIIKSIVTKEMYSSVKYRLGDDK